MIISTMPLGRLEREVDPEGAESRYEYDAVGNVLIRHENRTNTDGVVTPIETHYRYDNANREIKRIDAENTVHISVYNAHGEIIRQGTFTQARVNATDFDAMTESQVYVEYDAAGRMIKTNKDGGVDSVFLYDANGNQTAKIQLAEIEEIDTGSQIISLNLRESSLQQVMNIDPLIVNRTEYAYDARNQVTDVFSSPIEVNTADVVDYNEVWNEGCP